MTSNRPPAFFVGEHLADRLRQHDRHAVGNAGGMAVRRERPGRLADRRVDRTGGGGEGKEVGEQRAGRGARQAREFRRRPRGFVSSRIGKPLRATVASVAPLNELLARDNASNGSRPPGVTPRKAAVCCCGQTATGRAPGELLQPIAEAAADLICHQDFRLIRSCEGSACTLVFLDRTKAHARRWCSMAVCGNRAKAAAHRARRDGGKRNDPAERGRPGGAVWVRLIPGWPAWANPDPWGPGGELGSIDPGDADFPETWATRPGIPVGSTNDRPRVGSETLPGLTGSCPIMMLLFEPVI